MTDAPQVRVRSTELLSQVTGPIGINRTQERFGFTATDLGTMWDAGPGPDGRDRIFVLFGDTYGEGWGGHGAGPADADWRTNVLLSSSTLDLDRDGLVLEAAVSRAGGGAAQLIRRSRLNLLPRVPFPEHTLIPNAGITVAGVHYVHWMSILKWGSGGRWRTFQAGIAASADDAQTWRKPLHGRWPNPLGRNRFQVGAFTRTEEHVYLFGTTNGRFGPAYLARVAPERVEWVADYEYFDGAGWSRSQAAAAPVIDGPVGELSVAFHRGLGCWLAVTLDEPRAAIVLRSAARITGPWSEPEVLAAGTDYPGLYGGFIHPWQLDGDSLYWLLSQWGPYNVFLMRSRLGR
ncbi:DUF4185 domain-containing protein [Granulicoccus phenolivorans]|uniref:DUF4185 domain-containing protein n=1 Tax=Granulicoccus phenolivorans TaxID=266854 RepID=UPI0004022D32|nr:DUF4185 domain-containing protein [Granulicoccus phenolivorans]